MKEATQETGRMAWSDKPPFVLPREQWVLDAPTRFETRHMTGLQGPDRYAVTVHDSFAAALAAARADRRAALYAVRVDPAETRVTILSPEWCAVAPDGSCVYPTAKKTPYAAPVRRDTQRSA